jgi:protein tyrosine/serine phosphatase
MAGLGRPTPQQISRVMAVIDHQENWPVFVHCKRGADRTGTIVALYRISHDHWTADQAVFEAKRHGLSRFAFRMRDYISDHYRDNQGSNSTTEQASRQVNGSPR